MQAGPWVYAMKTILTKPYRWLFFATIILIPELLGQDIGITPEGRLDQIQEQRSQKAGSLGLEPSVASGKNIGQIAHIMRLVPISFDVGGLGSGAGPAINFNIDETTYRGRLPVRVWGHVAVHGFYTVGSGAELRNVSAHDLTFALQGSYSDAPQLEYYGEGRNSSIHNRTNFRREDTLFSFRVGLRTHRDLAEVCRFEQLLLHIGPGTNDDLATTQSVFGPSEAPGIDVQSNYLIAGCSVQLDLRDFPHDPHNGTYAEAVFDRYYAESQGRFSFYRLSLTGEQYVPHFNSKRVIALRAKTELSFHSGDQVVPFYLQPTLASDTDLRGFRRYRFYDENSISLTAEYRWEISTGFDVALFVDGANVFHRPGEISLSQLASSAGFGFRFKNQSQRKAIARLDAGFSREGFQVWLKIEKLF